jgi:polysaccharide biosynthesis/export protein
VRATLLLLAGFALALCACASRSNPGVQAAAFTAQSTQQSAPREILPTSYRIGPLDELKVVVFKEPDLSSEALPVDLGGSISLPLVGQMQASGNTAAELGRQIADRLNVRYLRNAQVSVSVTKPVNYSFTVDGEVKKPGVYAIPGQLTLLQAVALGEGATEFAKQDEVIVFRDINGVRHAARFNLRDIRSARAPDPTIQQSDVVVVGFSRASRITRDLVTALPGLAGVFVALVR